jgi:dipeptidyl aminopeptidase/acylaminoacyl peptidase
MAKVLAKTRVKMIRTTIKIAIAVLFLLMSLGTKARTAASGPAAETDMSWRSPSEDILEVLNAPKLPWVWTSPTGEYLLLADPQLYPPLSDLAAPMHKLAGIRVNPTNNHYSGWNGATSPRIVKISDGSAIELKLPKKAELLSVKWTADGKRFALMLKFPKHIKLWVGSVNGKVKEIEGLTLNSLIGSTISWLPDMKRLLVKAIPKRDLMPLAPTIPIGPKITESVGASARSTYEARNLLQTAHDDKLFDYFATSNLVIVDSESGTKRTVGKPGVYRTAQISPDGQFLLIKRLKGPWSHEVAYWRFASEIEVWNLDGKRVASIASLPLADSVPVHGVPMGPRNITWRATAPHTLYWIEALDGGNPVAEVTHRDKLMSLKAPFKTKPIEIFKAEHRIVSSSWFEKGEKLMIYQRERIKRNRTAWLIDLEKNTSNMWYEYDEDDRYDNPGRPIYRQLANGYTVLKEKDNAIYFSGNGGTSDGDRPFLDLRSLETGISKRLFRSDSSHYAFFVAFAGSDEQFVLRSESSSEVPNYHLATFGKEIEAPEGESTTEITTTPITKFTDPTPQLREIEKQIVHYEREDGVALSFQLHLPPGYKKGTKLPTVLYAYPLEYSAKTAGQVRGSAQRFMRIYGPSHLYFLLKGYAVLERTSMPMVGDPETTYDTFVSQLVQDAEAAVKKAVEMGVTDPDRIGVMGHSHGALMVANLLAHTDLFKAGIARSGSYNKTNQPFGFQSERRSLFESRDVYIDLSPTFFADKVNEPVLIIHGDDDSNPGTLTFQSEVFYTGVSGSGGTARLVLLPFEDHGYRARESIEHVLWEQLKWFDKYVKGTKQNHVNK